MHSFHDAPEHTPLPAVPPTSRGSLGPAADAGGAPASPGLSALERALTAYGPETLLKRQSAAEEALRAAARLLASEARAADPVRAERLVVGLRQAWDALPALGRVPADVPRRAVWDRLVLLCCEEFYAPAAHGGSSPPGPPQA
jgi:hypothetical protein